MTQMGSPRASGGKTYEMLWDCKFCGTKKLLGKTHRFCPNCGAQQDAAARYFPAETEKVAVEDHVYVGADRICKACNTLTSAKAEFCGNCGSPMAETAQVQAGRERLEGAEGFGTEDLKQTQAAAAAAAAKPVVQKKGGIPWGKVLLIGIPLLVIVAIFILTRTTTTNAVVTSFRWERGIEVQKYSPVPGSGSCPAPIGAYSVDRRYEQVGTDRVADGETCTTVQKDQGDGTFREEERCETKYRDEPVYGYRCYYLTNQWIFDRTLTTAGTREDELVWSTEVLNTGDCLGCEREGTRSEQYLVAFKAGEKTFECPFPLQDWQTMPLEKGFTLEIGQFTGAINCDTLKPVS